MERNCETGQYRITGARLERHHESKFLRNVMIERLQQIKSNWGQEDLRLGNGPQHKGGFQPRTRHAKLWTVDLFWDMNQPTPVQSNQQDRPGPSGPTCRIHDLSVPMEEGEIDSETDRNPSVLVVPWMNWVSEKCPICEDMTRPKNRSRRTK